MTTPNLAAQEIAESVWEDIVDSEDGNTPAAISLAHAVVYELNKIIRRNT